MNKIAIVVFTAALSASSLNLAKADQPGADWMPAELVKQMILQFGYTEVSKLKADDGEWEGEGVKNSKKMAFRADPKTGAIIEEELDD
jgi:Peptidase propeptide and YPEB domain